MLHALGLGFALTASMSGAVAPPGDHPDALLSLGLEELGEVRVTATSRRASRLVETPASVFVIHGDEIRSLGIRTLPEALRLAPNLHVARTNASAYALSARGMKTSLSNKMLVMIDGRPIYTPLFAGVLWDMQQVPMSDIDRIEVVSGPGASAWGANAVNGVINIVTRSLEQMPGGAVTGWNGEEGRGMSAAQTFAAGATGRVRVYGRRTSQDDSTDAAGTRIPDGWTQRQGGFRSQWAVAAGELRVQGDVFRAESSPRPLGPIEARGHHLLARWTREAAGDARWSVSGYLDEVDRLDPVVIDDRLRIAAVELTHSRRLGAHDLSWGLGYRRARDESRPGFFVRLQPDARTLEWAHLYVQDHVALTAQLSADVGLRLDRNSYTGVEVLPTLRMAYLRKDGSLVWGALSRAVRSPARFDRDFHFPASEPFLIRGGPEFDSETVDVLELGLRAQPVEWLTVSATAFHHRYDELRGGRPTPQGVVVDNAARARSHGLEAWATARITGEWEVAAGLLELRQRRWLKPGFTGENTLTDQGNDPEHQILLRGTRRLGARHQVSLFARYVSALPAPAIPGYAQVDARWSYRPNPTVEFGIGANNLLDRRHAELQPVDGLAQSEFGRSAFADLRVDW